MCNDRGHVKWSNFFIFLFPENQLSLTQNEETDSMELTNPANHLWEVIKSFKIIIQSKLKFSKAMHNPIQS